LTCGIHITLEGYWSTVEYFFEAWKGFIAEVEVSGTGGSQIGRMMA